MERMEDMTNVKSLYSPKFEHDNCGIGAVVNIKGKKSHDTVANALTIVETLEHRAGKDAEGKTGDGVGILLQISHNSSRRSPPLSLGSRLARREIMPLVCSSSHRTSLREIRQRRCLR